MPHTDSKRGWIKGHPFDYIRGHNNRNKRSLKLGKTYKTLKERFWDKVEKNSINECWIWKGAVSHGYGVAWHNGKLIRAHRLSYEINFGNIPPKLLVLHKCDNPVCVNPQHLWLGNQQDNMNDMKNKRRSTKGRRKS